MEQRREQDGVTAGLLLIGLGTLVLTGWWWPGIPVVLGVAVASGLFFRGRYLAALLTGVAFFSVPLLVDANVSWQVLGPMALVGLGLVLLGKGVLLKES